MLFPRVAAADDGRVTTTAHPPPPRARSALFLAGFVAGCLIVGALAGLSTVDGVRTWYRTIAKPAWTPPDGLFGPVWTVLYCAMGFAAWRVWRRGPSPEVSRALGRFASQLVLNVAWSPIFFALHRPGTALVVIVVLDLALVRTIGAFRRIDRFGALVLVPYLAWCLFATALNAAIVGLA